MYLLPDILTVPLLVVGYAFAAFVGVWVCPAESAFGALVGYVMPVVATLILVWKDKDMFGGGDIKLLTAIGAWVGAEKLIYIILLSVFVFGLYALFRRQRSGAFGPAIAVSAIIIAFYFF
jgi:leader peptidase (prepilin peptidase)/N-methyltransferase